MVRGQNTNMNTEVWKNLITTLMDDWMVHDFSGGRTEDVVETARELESKVESEAMW